MTIIEILIVLAIMLGIVVMLTRGIRGAKDAAKEQQALVDMNGAVKTSLIMRFARERNLPANTSKSTAQILTSLMKGNVSTIVGSPIKSPWGTNYLVAYSTTGANKGVTITVEGHTAASDPKVVIPIEDFE
jgi:type II secretory pathway pseudopilin PulG